MQEKKEEAPAPVPAPAPAATPPAAAPKDAADTKPAEEGAAKDGATEMDTEGETFYQSSASSLATGTIDQRRALAHAIRLHLLAANPRPPPDLPLFFCCFISCFGFAQVLSWSRAFR